MSSLVGLSRNMAKNANIVSKYLYAHRLLQLSFDSDGLSVVITGDAPQKILKVQQNLISAALQIFQLVIEPSEFPPYLATGFHYIASLEWLCQYNIFHLVPLYDAISYAYLAAVSGIPEQRIKSLIRMAMTNALFREEPEGKHVSHSTTSSIIAKNPDVYNYATYMCARYAPIAMHMAAAHKRRGPGSMRTHETGYNKAFKTDTPFLDHLGRDKVFMSKFSTYMNHVKNSSGLNLRHLMAGFACQCFSDDLLVVDMSSSV
ncbi:hypothetical protein P280DRAFT_530385 [Massarina eburnea CBS 473.64]|uniref:Uncharacterized protein n=1 Tax=Massarina eburnea CBS 473.64 TaxID=1395130 RepID=A0A6A6RP56_9PLEO|nr:hypothetical protein P280DRAFT_530385 [Massarina eburnea CBS 473.64]